MKSLPNQIVSASRRDGFCNADDRDFQSIKDNLKNFCTLPELRSKTGLPSEMIAAYLRQLCQEKALVKSGSKIRYVE